MYRVTNQMIHNNLSSNLQRQTKEMDEISNALSTGKKVRIPRDNPVAAANQMLFHTRLTEVKQYIKNIDKSKGFLNQVDSNLQAVTEIFQRVRVLAVQASNGIYTTFERKEATATEINKLLLQLVNIANSKDGTGRSLFGGFKTGTQENPNPFVPIFQTLTAGNQGEAITGVEYQGDIGRLQREVAKGEYIDINIPGNITFWASNQILSSNKNAADYRSETNQKIKIDGVEINIAAEDNIDIIIDKINNAGLSARATLGGNNNLILEGTKPHQIWLEDVGSGRVFKDLGMINNEFSDPPNNLDPTVIVGGMSIFEMMIQLRRDLVKGDVELIGGRDLGAIDLALDNVLRNLAETGAKQNQVMEVAKRAEYSKVNITELLAKTEGIDYAEMTMNFNWMTYVHQYALKVGAKTIMPTLMDFLR